MSSEQDPHSLGRGVGFAILAYASWGLLPLYWKLLRAMPPLELVSHRMVWSGIFMLGLLFCIKGTKIKEELWQQRRYFLPLLFSASIITINWGLFIYTINIGRVLEASLGYFISPLMLVIFGMIFLKESLGTWQKISLALAALGVINLAFQAEDPPVLALLLAITFSCYGMVRKRISVEPLVASTIETLFQAIPGGLLALYYAQPLNTLEPGTFSFLLPLSGVFTALPLLWFASAARHLSLASLGFFQYLAPSLKFFLAIFIFNEGISMAQLASFSCIWAALGLYTVDSWQKRTKTVTCAIEAPLDPNHA